MKKVSFIALLVLSVVAGLFSSTAWAKVYVSGNLCGTYIQDSEVSGNSTTIAELTFDPGYGATGAIGLDVMLDVAGRLELEAGYKSNPLSEVSIANDASYQVDGSLETLTLMLNSFHDYKTDYIISPFIGVGIGVAKIDLDLGRFGQDSALVFAYQVAIGGYYPFTRNLNLEMQYRFLGTQKPTFAADDVNYAEFEADYYTHNLMLGLRYSF